MAVLAVGLGPAYAQIAAIPGETDSTSAPKAGPALRVMSLQECIQRALSRNYQIANQKLDEQSGQAAVREAKSDLYPHVKLKGSYQYYLNVPTQLVPAVAFGGPEGTYSTAQFQVAQSVSASADVAWQVYNPAILTALKIARMGQSIRALDTRSKSEAIVYDVSATYLNIQINELQMELTRTNIAHLRKNLQLTTQLFEQGRVGLATFDWREKVRQI